MVLLCPQKQSWLRIEALVSPWISFPFLSQIHFSGGFCVLILNWEQVVSKTFFFHEFWMIYDIWKCSSMMSDLIMTQLAHPYLCQSTKSDRFSSTWTTLVTIGCPLGLQGHCHTASSTGRNCFRKTKAVSGLTTSPWCEWASPFFAKNAL